jgi:hypothetical protein
MKAESRESISYLNTFLHITYLFDELALFRNLKPVMECKSSSATISASGSAASDPLWRFATWFACHVPLKQAIARTMAVETG